MFPGESLILIYLSDCEIPRGVEEELPSSSRRPYRPTIADKPLYEHHILCLPRPGVIMKESWNATHLQRHETACLPLSNNLLHEHIVQNPVVRPPTPEQ